MTPLVHLDKNKTSQNHDFERFLVPEAGLEPARL